jgi:hypothetical protein
MFSIPFMHALVACFMKSSNMKYFDFELIVRIGGDILVTDDLVYKIPYTLLTPNCTLKGVMTSCPYGISTNAVFNWINSQ